MKEILRLYGKKINWNFFFARMSFMNFLISWKSKKRNSSLLRLELMPLNSFQPLSHAAEEAMFRYSPKNNLPPKRSLFPEWFLFIEKICRYYMKLG